MVGWINIKMDGWMVAGMDVLEFCVLFICLAKPHFIVIDHNSVLKILKTNRLNEFFFSKLY